MNKLDAYVRITCTDATAIAQGAIDGIMKKRATKFSEASVKFVARETGPIWFRPMRWFRHRMGPTEARALLTTRLSKFKNTMDYGDNLVYQCWRAVRLNSDMLCVAKALLESSDERLKSKYVFINLGDIALMRCMATWTHDNKT